MGGIIKVVIRFGGGEVVADVRNTNPLAFWIRNPRLIRGEEAVMREYVEMGKGHTRGDTTFAPSEYGTFVVDYATRTILSANSYSDGRMVNLQEAKQVIHQFGTLPGTEEQTFEEMIREGFLEVVRRYPDESYGHRRGDGTIEMFDPGDDPDRRVDLTGVTLENWDERVFLPYSRLSPVNYRLPLEQYEAMPDCFILIRYPGWNFEQFEDGIPGQDKVRVRLRDLGFAFTPECDRAYAAWRTGKEECEARDREYERREAEEAGA